MIRVTWFIAGLFGYLLAGTAFAQSIQTIGWIEHVEIQPQNIRFRAKIDTGADNSSIHADKIEVYEKEGMKMVKFVVENIDGHRAEFNLPLVRYAKIKRKRAEPLLRPVVSMGLCIGNTLKTANINLANRENFRYRMLIGRSYLKDQYLVDSGKKHVVEPACGTHALTDKTAS